MSGEHQTLVSRRRRAQLYADARLRDPSRQDFVTRGAVASEGFILGRTRNLQRATATATPPSGASRALSCAESAFAKVCARSHAPLRRRREIESRLTAPCAANRPAWPRRTSASAALAAQKARPPNENQGKRRRRRARSGGGGLVGSNRGLFCQCSLVHEVTKSWCEGRLERSTSSGRRRERDLRWGSDTAIVVEHTFPSFRQSSRVNR